MNRATQKTTLIAELETIEYSGNLITVSDKYLNDEESYPYFVVYSGEFRTEFSTNRSYKEVRTYFIDLCFSMNQAIEAVVIDTIEELFITKLRSEKVKDQNPNSWLDLRLIDVSSPYQQPISESDQIVIKTIKVEAENYPLYN